jgi:hypothetical protein
MRANSEWDCHRAANKTSREAGSFSGQIMPEANVRFPSAPRETGPSALHP